MNRLHHLMVVVLLTAVLGLFFYFSPTGQKIEENLGLALLFRMRGPVAPPGKVVIVNLDPASSEVLDLPDNISKWPRGIHAELINTLKRLGASSIVFDVHFAEPREREQDRVFVSAVERAGNVILFEELTRQTITRKQYKSEKGVTVEMDTLVPPFSPLAESAIAVAPFPLPKLPVRVNQAWIFKRSIGEKPTMPAVALQVAGMKHYDLLYSLLQKLDSQAVDTLPGTIQEVLSRQELTEIIRKFREIFRSDPSLAARVLSKIRSDAVASLSQEEKETIGALVKMYSGGNSIYLNLYGPPGTIPTFSYHELFPGKGTGVEVDESLIKGRAVFIGAARKNWSRQKDGFYTVYSQQDGLDLSGVELAATTFANLFEDSSVKHPDQWQNSLLLVSWGIAVAFVCFFLSPFPAALSLLVLSFLYIMTGNYFFSAAEVWLPVVTPVALQTSAAFLSSVLLKNLITGREKENIRKALGHYLPDKVVNELSRDLSYIKTGDQMVYSACLMTDAQNYTTLSEKVDPVELSRLMKEYFSYLYEPVRERDGLICDVVGDSMLALWPSAKPHSQLRENACHASLQVLEAVQRFNRDHPHSQLPTRIGLHYGYILMGNIGADSHFEYAPVGDIINTVSRIEGLNKHLDSRILASEETVKDVPGILTRKLGKFLLAGKSKPVVIYELVAKEDQGNQTDEALCSIFSEALDHFHEKRWDRAAAFFNQCVALQGQDGPSSYYLQFCKTYRHDPPADDWHGIMRVGKSL